MRLVSLAVPSLGPRRSAGPRRSGAGWEDRWIPSGTTPWLRSNQKLALELIQVPFLVAFVGAVEFNFFGSVAADFWVGPVWLQNGQRDSGVSCFRAIMPSCHVPMLPSLVFSTY